MQSKRQFKRILLKLSGEALLDKDNSNIISPVKLKNFADEIKAVYNLGIQLAIVVGGGNIFRGETSEHLSLSRFKADNIGMLATIINSLALEDYLNSIGVLTEVMSAIEMNKIAPFYTSEKALRSLGKDKVVILAGGIANPYFSTDTGAVVRALEINADIVLKGTQVDGIYNKDPKKFPNAIKYEVVSHAEAIYNNLSVVDITAIILAQKSNLKIAVFNINEQGNFKDIVTNKKNYSVISS